MLPDAASAVQAVFASNHFSGAEINATRFRAQTEYTRDVPLKSRAFHIVTQYTITRYAVGCMVVSVGAHHRTRLTIIAHSQVAMLPFYYCVRRHVEWRTSKRRRHFRRRSEWRSLSPATTRRVSRECTTSKGERTSAPTTTQNELVASSERQFRATNKFQLFILMSDVCAARRMINLLSSRRLQDRAQLKFVHM